VQPYLSDVALFLVDTILGIYILLVLLRFLLQLVRADFYNPVSQFIVRTTNPPLTYLRRLIPSSRRIDVSALLMLLGMEIARISLVSMLLGHNPRMIGVILLTIAELVKLATHIVIFSIFVRALLSWFSGGSHHPLTRLLGSFTDPILRPVRRVIPMTSGIDLSPLVLFFGLILALKLIVRPLMDAGNTFM